MVDQEGLSIAPWNAVVDATTANAMRVWRDRQVVPLEYYTYVLGDPTESFSPSSQQARDYFDVAVFLAWARTQPETPDDPEDPADEAL